MARGHGAARRWAVVVGLIAVCGALPALIGALPAKDSDASAADLRAAVLASTGVGFSGYAESAGGLALPVTDQLSSVADLFSDRTTMRVWWRGAEDNRVDVVSTAGETDVHSDAAGNWTWEYEANRATRTRQAPLALPAATDLLPSTLGRRLLSEAAGEELTRLAARRIAGRDALGLRLVPAAAASSVSRVDLWVDAATGLPLQVRLFTAGAPVPALDSRFIDLALTTPPAQATAFTPPPGATVLEGQDPEVLADAGRRLAALPLPDSLAGLPRRTLAGAPEAIGLYGRGVTLLAVAPVPPRLSGDLRRAAAGSPDAVTDALGTRLSAGPLGIMLVGAPGGTQYLLTGTVTLDALAQAAGELPDVRSQP
jgi:outer membrane lipoprotein-sorting protein